jgi:hypothetical protein
MCDVRSFGFKAVEHDTLKGETSQSRPAGGDDALRSALERVLAEAGTDAAEEPPEAAPSDAPRGNVAVVL